MSTALYVLIAIGAIALIIMFIYNRLVALRQAWKRAFSDINVQLKQRHDLVPNLVETVKGYAAHEKSALSQGQGARRRDERAGPGADAVRLRACSPARSAI